MFSYVLVLPASCILFVYAFVDARDKRGVVRSVCDVVSTYPVPGLFLFHLCNLVLFNVSAMRSVAWAAYLWVLCSVVISTMGESFRLAHRVCTLLLCASIYMHTHVSTQRTQRCLAASTVAFLSCSLIFLLHPSAEAESLKNALEVVWVAAVGATLAMLERSFKYESRKALSELYLSLESQHAEPLLDVHGGPAAHRCTASREQEGL